jgi:mono/diheme cytochrome c family protein
MHKLLLASSMLLCSVAVQAQQPDLEHGKQVYDVWCTPCHAPGPRKHPGTAALQVLYKGEKPAVLEERLDLTPELVAYFVRNGVSIMPFFRKTEISDKDLADLAAYLSRH